MLALLALALGGPLEDGAAAYDAGDWAAAIDAWSAIDNPSGVVLYDLGNAWYRQGDVPRALAAWRGAARTRPRNGDLAHNLALARGELEDLPPPVDPPVVWQAFVTVGELGLASTALLGAASWLLVRRRRWAAVPVALAGLIGAAATLNGSSAVVNHPVAVVVDGVATARDAARPDAGHRFVLQPGSEVRVERRLSGFVLITTGDGRRGWVASGSVVALGVPASSG